MKHEPRTCKKNIHSSEHTCPYSLQPHLANKDKLMQIYKLHNNFTWKANTSNPLNLHSRPLMQLMSNPISRFSFRIRQPSR